MVACVCVRVCMCVCEVLDVCLHVCVCVLVLTGPVRSTPCRSPLTQSQQHKTHKTNTKAQTPTPLRTHTTNTKAQTHTPIRTHTTNTKAQTHTALKTHTTNTKAQTHTAPKTRHSRCTKDTQTLLGSSFCKKARLTCQSRHRSRDMSAGTSTGCRGGTRMARNAGGAVGGGNQELQCGHLETQVLGCMYRLCCVCLVAMLCMSCCSSLDRVVCWKGPVHVASSHCVAGLA